jgi:pimeloyl-ACP methyl ester carboxylesterase
VDAKEQAHKDLFERLGQVRAEAIEHASTAQELAAERRELIRQLTADGLSQADIARELGVTRQANPEDAGMLTSGVARSAGADLYFERRGSGQALLLIVGGGGDCGYYNGLAGVLADEFTVLSYDRRGNSRSSLHGRPAPLVMAEQSADALAVLDASGIGSALVFGNSGGASIALDLAARHPDRVRAAVAHEPPIPAVLPDPADYFAVYDEMDRLLAAEGWVAAFTHFQATIGQAPPEAIAALLDPEVHLPPGPLLELMLRVSRNWEFMTRFEVHPIIRYRPDFGRITASRTPVALARGTGTGTGTGTSDHAAIRMSEIVAARLGAGCVVFSGGHTAPMDIPSEFGAALRRLLHRLRSAGEGASACR